MDDNIGPECGPADPFVAEYRSRNRLLELPFVERQHPRFPLHLPVSFSGNQEGIGTVKNLSLGGCQVESQTPAYTGDYLNLQMQLPGEDSPLTVRAAAVRWSEGHKFGLSFDWLEPVEQERLKQFLTTLGA